MCSYYSLSLRFVHYLYSELSFRVGVLAIASMSETFSCTRGGLHLPSAICGVLCMPVMLSQIYWLTKFGISSVGKITGP